MSDSNRARLSWSRNTVFGVLDNAPRQRLVAFTGEGLGFKPTFTQSARIRDDRMNDDPSKTNESNTGPINDEISFPVDKSPRSDFYASLFCNEWQNTPFRDNDGVADSAITGVTAADDTFVVLNGAAFVVGHLVRASGFAQGANNGIFRAIAGSDATHLVTADGRADEAVPAAAARLKVVGFQGVAGDIETVADGLISTTLDFTTLGLRVGGWLKVGGAAAGDKFVTPAVNDWVRIVSVVAHKITLDNLPAGWDVDDGDAKTIKVWFGDQIKNGVTKIGGSIERGFMDQAVPTYIRQDGMTVGQYEATLEAGQIAKDVFTFTGMIGQQSTVSADDTPDALAPGRVMSAAVNVGRLSENGVALASPNWAKSIKISANNNIRTIDAIRSDGKVGPVDIAFGSFDVQVDIETYFGSNALYAKLLAGTPSNLNTRMAKDGQAIVFAVPRLTFTDGAPNASAKNQDVMLSLTSMASKDDLTGAHLLLDRLEYFE